MGNIRKPYRCPQCLVDSWEEVLSIYTRKPGRGFIRIGFFYPRCGHAVIDEKELIRHGLKRGAESHA